MPVRKNVEENGSNAMLAIKRSAGIAPELNLRIPLHVDDEAPKQGNLPWGSKPQEVLNRGTRGPQKGLMSSKILF